MGLEDFFILYGFLTIISNKVTNIKYHFLHWKRNAARQTTGPIQLVKGRVYFIEALMEDAGGPDHITVRVRLPSGTIQTPVSKEDFYTTPPGKNSLCLLVLIVHF